MGASCVSFNGGRPLGVEPTGNNFFEWAKRGLGSMGACYILPHIRYFPFMPRPLRKSKKLKSAMLLPILGTKAKVEYHGSSA